MHAILAVTVTQCDQVLWGKKKPKRQNFQFVTFVRVHATLCCTRYEHIQPPLFKSSNENFSLLHKWQKMQLPPR